MAIVRWDPFAELNSLHNQVNSLFNEAFGGNMPIASGMTPATDIFSDKNGLTVEVHVPNFKEDEISVEQHQNELEIKAEHHEKEESDDRKYLVRESVNKYYRRFTLPKNADTENITAKFEDGVLRVKIPYKELPAPKRIAISAKSKSPKDKK